MKFWKYHGLGNDFIIINNMDGSFNMTCSEIERLCHRRFGIGGDGLILVEASSQADIKMIIYNSDGSRPEMCGNGVRCFAKHIYDKGFVKKDCIAVETDAGIMSIQVNSSGGKAITAVVNMGKPDFVTAHIPAALDTKAVIDQELNIDGNLIRVTSMRMGVPHTVVFTDVLDDESIISMGRLIENSSYFPNKTNVNFVKILDRENIVLRTWERGAGYTYACGTGACASVAAGIMNGLLNEKTKVQLRGGDLIIEWKDRGDIYMEGPSEEVFEGNYTNC